MSVYSNNGEILYADGFEAEECQICREEHTDIREISSSGRIDLIICWYCANERFEKYQPAQYLGAIA